MFHAQPLFYELPIKNKIFMIHICPEEIHKFNIFLLIISLMTREFIIKINKLKSMLKSRATGELNYDETEYQLIRNEIITDQNLNPYIPDFLVFSENLDSFWYFIKETFSTYNKRRIYLEESFDPLLNYLEKGIVPEKNDGLSELGIYIMKLKLMLGSLATGGSNYDETEYQLIRDKIIVDQNLQTYIPDFLLFCQDGKDFWKFIKEKYRTYDERREYLKEAFEPVFIYLKQSSEPAQNSVPVQKPIPTVPTVPTVPVQKPIPIVPVQKPVPIVPVQKAAIEKEKYVYEYDVALSFAGEDRDVVEEIAMELKNNNISVFYDKFQKANLWGKELSQHFKKTYGANTRFVIVFISEHYALKDWTDFEFSIARQEAKTRKREFILPIRIDNTNIVGLHNDVGYLDLNKENVKSIVETISEKLKT